MSMYTLQVVFWGIEPSLTLFVRILTPSKGTSYAQGALTADGASSSCQRKVSENFALYRGMGIGFCVFGASTDGGLEPDVCSLLRHLSYAHTTRDLEARGLDGTRRDLDEYRCASSRTFRHILMNCTLLLSHTGLLQRLPDRLPDPGLWS
jgi:hypothetical protein